MYITLNQRDFGKSILHRAKFLRPYSYYARAHGEQYKRYIQKVSKHEIRNIELKQRMKTLADHLFMTNNCRRISIN